MKEPDKDLKLMGSLMREMAKVYDLEGYSPRWQDLKRQLHAIRDRRKEVLQNHG